MKVIAVDNNPEDLKALCNAIRSAHPEADIVYFIDPLLAFKYSVTNPLDSLYTAIQMKRLGGFALVKMVREDHPDISVHFIAEDITYMTEAIRHNADSCMIKPVTTEKLIMAESEER